MSTFRPITEDPSTLCGGYVREDSRAMSHAPEQPADAAGGEEKPDLALDCAVTAAAAIAASLAYASSLSVRVKAGNTNPYLTFEPTVAGPSIMKGAGTGLFPVSDLEPFTWLGMYPGKVSAKLNGKRAAHTMGVADGVDRELYVIAEHELKSGVHMVNEATPPHVANTWYVKLSNGHILYFIGQHVSAGQELMTCYSRQYGKRVYPTPNKCTDPRCTGTKHRTQSGLCEGWREALLANTPAGLPKGFLKAAGLER